MITDQTLAAEMYLLAYDLRRDLLTDKRWLDYLVRGAALTELLADGAIAVHEGVIGVASDRVPVDAALRHVMEDVEHGMPRSWKELLHESDPTFATIQDELVQSAVIEVDDRGAVVVRDRLLTEALQTWVRTLLTAEQVNDAETHRLDAALVPLAGVVPLRTVVSKRQWRENARRVTMLTGRVVELLPEFEHVIARMRKTRRLAYSAGGPVH